MEMHDLIAVVRERLKTPQRIADLTANLEKSVSVSAGEIREAVWELLDRGEVTLTADRKLLARSCQRACCASVD